MHIKSKVVFGTLLLTGELDFDYTIIIIQTIIVYDPGVFHDLLTLVQGHISRVKVTMHV